MDTWGKKLKKDRQFEESEVRRDTHAKMMVAATMAMARMREMRMGQGQC
jgi:hypothetical protein